MTRFNSLLKIFGLENRLVEESEMNLGKIINTSIDFDRVNKILESKKNEAFRYLENALQPAGI